MQMNRIIKFAFAAVAVISTSIGCAQEWEPLVKGDTLEGWTQRGGNATYTVEDGVITGRTAPGQKQNAFLCTDQEWSDFELELEFKVDPELNSGVQIRSQSDPDYKNGRVHGYQVEIDPSPRSYSGGIYDEARRGWLQDLSENEEARKAFKPGEWNKLFISAKGDTIRTKINGVDAATIKDDMTTRGFIALQVHATKSTEPLQVQWRNIRLADWDKVKITHWESDSPFGDYEGTASDGQPLVAQVIDLGEDRFRARFKESFQATEGPFTEVDGKMQSDGTVVFPPETIQGKIKDGVFIGELADGTTFELKHVKRESPTEGAEPPEGATVLLNGKGLSEWQKSDGSEPKWKIADNGAMEVVPKTGNHETKKTFGDMDLHLEFRTSLMPFARGQQRANSGVYVQGTYEVQVLDSYALDGKDNECGGIYKVGAPLVNMAYPPLSWQTYDISFKAAKWDGDKKTENARITVKHNGVVVQDNVELPEATGGAKFKGEPNHPAPLLLQDHGNKIQFRNIWAVSGGQ